MRLGFFINDLIQSGRVCCFSCLDRCEGIYLFDLDLSDDKDEIKLDFIKSEREYTILINVLAD